MSLIASRCLAADRHDHAPAKVLPIGMPCQIRSLVKSVATVRKFRASRKRSHPWTNRCHGEYVKWMGRQWHIVERGVAFQRDRPTLDQPELVIQLLIIGYCYGIRLSIGMPSVCPTWKRFRIMFPTEDVQKFLHTSIDASKDPARSDNAETYPRLCDWP
jgi:hypothetical protein